MTKLLAAKSLVGRVIAGATGAIASIGVAFAQSADGPVDGGIAMLPAASKLAEEVHFFHNIILVPIITVISLIVLALLLYVMARYNSKNNPVPHRFSHNTVVEVIWTGLPIIILVAIALPSFELLFKEDVIPDGKMVTVDGDGATYQFNFDNDFPASRMVASDRHVQVFLGTPAGVTGLVSGKDYTLSGLGSPKIGVKLNQAPAAGDRVVVRMGRSLVGVGDNREIALAPTMTLKAIGFQWGWTYSYPDFGDFEFTANMLEAKDTTPALYRFETDNHIVVPVGETIRVVTTARDVIHAWALPNMAIKIDAVPGRLNETWFNAEREGVFYGQCSEICGVRHSAMPITVEVVSRPAFEAWVDQKRQESGMEPMFSKIAAADAVTQYAEAKVADASAPAADAQ